MGKLIVKIFFVFLLIVVVAIMLIACNGKGSDAVFQMPLIPEARKAEQALVASSNDVEVFPWESNSNHTNYFLLQLGQALAVNASVSYQTRNGTALAGEDYVASIGVATIPAGQTRVLIGVEIIGDYVEETNETFYLVISNPIGGKFLTGVSEISAMHTIMNDDDNYVDPSIMNDDDNYADPSIQVAKNLAGLAFSSIQPILKADDLLTTPDRFANALLIPAYSVTATLNCDSGSFTYNFTDPNNDQRYSTAGDKFVVSTNHCQQDGMTLNGNYTLQITTASQDATTSTSTVGTTLQLTDLSQNDGVTTVVFNGNLQFTGVEQLNGSGKSTTLASSSTSLATSSGQFSFSNLSGTVSEDYISGEQTVAYQADVTVTGGTDTGTYHIETLSGFPLKKTNFENYPHEGKVKVRCLSGGNVGITSTAGVLSDAVVRVETDKNSDGVSEYIQDITWNSLLPNGF